MPDPLHHEVATLLAHEVHQISWAEALSISGKVLKLVAKPDVYPEHTFAQACQHLWPGIRQGEITTLRLLLSKKICRHDELLLATDSKSESTDIVKVWISHLRRRTGAKILNVYRIGYSMPQAEQELLKQKIGELT